MKAVLRIVLVLALVLGMVLGLSVTAQAEEPTTGTLRVTKVVEPDNYETDEEFPLQLYHVVDGVETPVGEPQSVQVGETAEWTGLEPGSYKVVETLPSEYYKAENDGIIETTVEAGETKELTLTNYVLGTLSFIKLVSVPDDDPWYPEWAEFKALYRKKVEGAENEWQSLTLPVGEVQHVFVEPGTYEVDEIVTYKSYVMPGWYYRINDTDPRIVDVVVEPGPYEYDDFYLEVTILNQYTPTGTLIVTKYVDPESGDFDPNTEFHFTIEPDEGPLEAADNGNGDVEFPIHFTLKNGESKTFHLPPGWYLVDEELPNDNWDCYWVEVTDEGGLEQYSMTTLEEEPEDDPTDELVYLDAGHFVTLKFKNIYFAPDEPPTPPPPPPPTTGVLTVKYIDATTNEPLHNPTTHTGLLGTTLTVTAKTFEGYKLVEGQSAVYEHEVQGTAIYTFLYEPVETEVEVPPEEPPLAPTGGIPITAMYGAGVLLLGLGLALRKQRR